MNVGTFISLLLPKNNDTQTVVFFTNMSRKIQIEQPDALVQKIYEK